MGRSVQLHEGIVFVAIVGGVVYGGILGALVVVPVLASLGVIGRYLRQRILDVEPFPGVEAPTADEEHTSGPTPEESQEKEKAEA